MPKELWAALEQDAEQRNRTTAEHLREICRQAIQQDVQDIYSRINAVEDSVEKLEQRVEQLEQRTEQIDELEECLDRLEAQMSGLTARTVDSSQGEQRTAAEGGGREVPESVADIDDVVAMARAEFGAAESQVAVGREALELLRERRRVSIDELQTEIRRDATDPDDSADVWWAEQVKPFVDIAIEWGLVVQHPGHELAWIGPPN